MIGSDAAFSLPCWGSSMANLTVPFEVSAGSARGCSAPGRRAPRRSRPKRPAGCCTRQTPASSRPRARSASETSFNLLLILIDRATPDRSRSVHPPAPSRSLAQACRPLPDAVPRGQPPRVSRWLMESLARAAVHDGRRRRIPARAARRMPPKRCRIICIGGPIATPTSATRAWLPSLPLATPRGPIGTGVNPIGPRRDRSRPPALRGGIKARVEYLVRTARITDIDRLVALSDAVIRSSGRCGRARLRRTCSDSWSTSRRRASSSPRFGARSSVGRSSPSGLRFAPADSWGRSTFSWWIPTTMPSA